MDRQKYSNGSLGKIQSKYANVSALTGNWDATTQNEKINLSASGNRGSVNQVSASYKNRNTDASLTRDSFGNTNAAYRKQLNKTSSVSASVNRPKGGGTQYGIKYQKFL